MIISIIIIIAPANDYLLEIELITGIYNKYYYSNESVIHSSTPEFSIGKTLKNFDKIN